MRVSQEYSIVQLSQAAPGELITGFPRGGLRYGIVLGHDKGKTLVGALPDVPGKSATPVMARLPEMKVVSLGSDWILQPLPADEMFVGNHKGRLNPGSLRLTDSGWVLTLGGWPGSYEDEVHFNLATSELCDAPDQASAPVFSWEIWPSSESVFEADQPLLKLNLVE